MTRTSVLVLALLPGLLRAADPPAETLKVHPRALEELRFPPGTIIVVRDSHEGLDKVDAVVLSPEAYRQQVETIEQLRKQLATDKPQPPSKCRISGKVETRGAQEVVRLHVVFELVNPSVRSTWFLGFRKAAAVAATVDGKSLPALDDATDGFKATIDEPGPHTLALDLELSLQTLGAKLGERGFALNLPGSPITVIEQFDLPPGVEAVRLQPLVPVSPLTAPATVRTLSARDLQKPAGDWPALVLGSVEAVRIFWDNPTPKKPTEPLLSAEGDVRVQISESSVQTSANLVLRSLRGRPTEWRLQSPPGADVTVPAAGNDLGATVTATNDDHSQWVIRVRDSGAEAVPVEVTLRQPREPGKPVPIGPFNLMGAFRQQGTIRVFAPGHLRPRLSRLRGDVSQRELPGDSSPETAAEFLQAAFSYGQVSASSPGLPLMFADSETVAGEVRTQVMHQLVLGETGWRLTTDIKATPIRRALEFVEIEIPPVLQATLEVGPRELVEKIERVDAASNRWHIRLAHPRRVETTVRLEAVYPRPEPVSGGREGARETARLTLPRVLQSYDADGRVNVIVPEGAELSGTVREWDRDRVVETGRPLEPQPGPLPAQALTVARTPAILELSWGPQGANVAVQSLVDVTLDEYQASVRQRLTVPASATGRQLTLRTAGPSISQLRAESGAVLRPRGEREWILTVPPGAQRDSTVELSYVQPLGDRRRLSAGALEVGLAWPMTLGRCETRVRVWISANAGLRPLPAAPSWEVLPVSRVPERPSLPALELWRDGPAAPLSLELAEAAGLAPANLIAERVLIQVAASESGQHGYLARFLLHKVAAASADVELPAAVGAINNLEVFVDGKRLDQVAVVDGNGAPASPATGRIIRVPLPGQGATIELALRYLMPNQRPADGLLARWQLLLTPPRLRGPVFVGAIRWHVLLPGDDFVLPADARVILDERWGLRRFLPAPVPSRTARELEQWFRGGSDESAVEEPAGSRTILRPAALEPVRLMPVPRMTWYLLCSLGVLIVGGTLLIVRRTRWLFWPALTLFFAAGAVIALLWPQLAMTILAGTPPGILVLTLLVSLMTWQARRYHRRVVFLPSFSRTKPPSTTSRPASSQRRREPTTVDAPPVP